MLAPITTACSPIFPMMMLPPSGRLHGCAGFRWYGAGIEAVLRDRTRGDHKFVSGGSETGKKSVRVTTPRPAPPH
jgi:hypothetical protein